MNKKKLSPSGYFLIAANLLPLIGVWAWHWDPKEMFLVYCLETIIVGLLNIVRMAIVTMVKKPGGNDNNAKPGWKMGIFFMIFFLVHYGIFVGVQMGIFFGVSGIGKENGISVFNFFYKWPALLHNDSLIVLGIFLFGYFYKMVIEFIFSGEYRTTSLIQLMFQPYIRIFIQQFTVIIGSMFLSFGAGKIFILIFAAVRIFFELFTSGENFITKRIKMRQEKSGQ